MAEPPEGRELVPYDPEAFARDKARVEDGFWAKLRRSVGRAPFVEDALAAYYCARDPATPMQVKAVLFGALAYFVMPTDMIPDFVAALGLTDDIAVLYAAIRTVAPHIKDRHREQARDALERLTGEAG
jgi:uncharacterized membrane protein YkvA (DUF1232 family)